MTEGSENRKSVKILKMNIVITGASSGIGKTIGEYLVAKGHRVVGTSRHKEGVFGNLEIVRLDVTDDDSVEKFVPLVIQKLNSIDALINCAGFVISGPVENFSIEECKSLFETNYFGTIRVTTALLPHFRENGKGKIFNMSSMAGLIGMPFQAHYSASKFALEGLTEALRLELFPFNIQVCNINPGDFNTNFTANRKITAIIGVAYKDKFNQVLSMYERDENNGSNPIMIAKLVESLLYKKKLKVRYVIGKPTQTIAISLKRIFGESIFEYVMKKIWKV